MELKIRRNRKGQFESAKQDERKDKDVVVTIADDKDLMKRVECAVQAFSDPGFGQPQEEEPVKVDVTHHRYNDDFPTWVIDACVKGAVILFLIFATAYVGWRI